MANLETEALTISLDEPAFNLLEDDYTPSEFSNETGARAPWTGEMMRLQKIQVVRNEQLVAWWKVLGPSRTFTGDPLHLPSGKVIRNHKNEITRIICVHTVGQLVDMADKERGKPSYIAEIEPTPLWDAWEQVVEDKPGLLLKRSSFGFGGERIRNG